jgi:hypothetical protein
MKGSPLASRPRATICPFCGAGELRPSEDVAHCDFCARAVEGPVPRTLEQIIPLEAGSTYTALVGNLHR